MKLKVCRVQSTGKRSPSLWEGQTRSGWGGRSSLNSSIERCASTFRIAGENQLRSTEQFTLPGGCGLWPLPPTLPEGG